MLVKSNLGNITYSSKDVVRIVNQKQQRAYLKARCYPIDIYISYDPETEKDLMVMIFLKSETQELFNKWKNYELE